MARTYESALTHLAALQSNKTIVSLFPPPENAQGQQDINALALPEMRAWLERSGISMQELEASGMKCVHVAGTKGKGSVCAYLTALLLGPRGSEAQGKRAEGGEGKAEDGISKERMRIRQIAGKVGTYTSPHLVSVRERIAIDGVPISRELFARYFFEIWDACTEAARRESSSQPLPPQPLPSSPEILSLQQLQQLQRKQHQERLEPHLSGPATKPFYFRFLTLVALRAFLSEGVRSAVIECGIGGEYDSTNVLTAEMVSASVVAQLGIDHVGMLGNTLPRIAWHKAGVCKRGRRCFTRRLTGRGGEGEETMKVLRERATEKGARLVEVGDEEVERWGGSMGMVRDKGEGLRKDTLDGEFQKYNQALAVLAAREHLRVLAGESSRGSEDDEKLENIPTEFTSALQNARLRGRCETIEDEEGPITWLIDGAHTTESLAEVARWFVGKLRSESENGWGRDKQMALNVILLFNQQDRDAAKLLSGLLNDIKKNSRSFLPSAFCTSTATTHAASTSTSIARSPKIHFSEAVFTRNELTVSILPATHEEEAESGIEARTKPEIDLSVQEAAAEALLDMSPGTVTWVMDNVADAVGRVRMLAYDHQEHYWKCQGERGGGGRGRVEGATKMETETKTLVLVTGSLHLVGAVLRTLEPGAED
ncbi:FolC bifunctional protein [Astrocystis sublimbata]|nr:FolC bifunctional protein [Astrocystis sublimbata]